MVLAAGQSIRLVRPKLILLAGGISLFARVVAAIQDGGINRMMLVKSTAGVSSPVEAARGEGAELVIAPRTHPT